VFNLVSQNMKESQIIENIKNAGNIAGTTVNERLWICNLMEEFDSAKVKDKIKARRILELLRVDNESIERMLR